MIEKFWVRYLAAGCLILLCVVLRGHWWSQEHTNRASRIHDSVRPGMSFDAVESLLIYTNICVRYSIGTGGLWQSTDRIGFMQTLGQPEAPSTNLAKIAIDYVLPRNSLSFEVVFNSTGGVDQTGPFEKGR